ncbi:hypothetical protein [Curtobacterium sp. MCBD17_008]|uniref:hypothetical protein n=1 Tax=Curtobacterium sp. MCBD17_008 TaxID=2175656 RepID=UPI0011B6EFD2|nr:hypothetical protein [Curtobacterium sp. MCBD17_008]
MTGEDPQESRTLSRWLFGRPSLWLACGWLVVGLMWLGLAVAEPSAFRYFIAAPWIIGGIGMLIVALRDRANRRGR